MAGRADGLAVERHAVFAESLNRCVAHCAGVDVRVVHDWACDAAWVRAGVNSVQRVDVRVVGDHGGDDGVEGIVGRANVAV